MEAMESAEPEIIDVQAELDKTYKPTEEEKEVEEDIKKEKKEVKELDEEESKQTAAGDKLSPEGTEKVEIKSEGDTIKMEVDEVSCKPEHQNSINEELTSVKTEMKVNIDSIKSDAKTNVTSDEIKQETEAKNANTGTEETKNEENFTDEEITSIATKMEDKVVEVIPNGDKCNHVNNSHYSNGKELNGTFICGEF